MQIKQIENGFLVTVGGKMTFYSNVEDIQLVDEGYVLYKNSRNVDGTLKGVSDDYAHKMHLVAAAARRGDKIGAIKDFRDLFNKKFGLLEAKHIIEAISGKL